MTRPDEEPPEWAKRKAREIMAAGESADDSASDAGGSDGSPPDGPSTDEYAPDIPPEAVTEAERLTRLAREAVDPAAARQYRDRRDALVDDHDYTPRLREEDDTLVLYPSEWVEDGTVRFDQIEDTDRAVEVSLSGPGDADRYSEVAAYNAAVAGLIAVTVAEVVDRTVPLPENASRDVEPPLDPVEPLAELTSLAEADPSVAVAHAENARRFVTFLSNHYVRPVDEATPGTRAEFREEYLPRNGWPSDVQLDVVEESLALIDEVAAEVNVAALLDGDPDQADIDVDATDG